MFNVLALTVQFPVNAEIAEIVAEQVFTER